jgi:hypothetical protein
MTMPFKFEWQFKYRDESNLNADGACGRVEGKKPSVAKG